jgi:hypothetical protein
MRTILIGLTLAVIVILLALLALLVIVRAGIRHQKRAACLICHPPGLAAALARRVLRLYARTPAHECHQAGCTTAAASGGALCLPTRKGPTS